MAMPGGNDQRPFYLFYSRSPEYGVEAVAFSLSAIDLALTRL